MKTLLVLVALVALPSCRIFRYSEYSRRDRCAETLPILDDKPAEPFQIVRVVSADSDYRLRWYACAAHADAVIRAGVGSSFSGWTFSSSTELRGLAIKWENREGREP